MENLLVAVVMFMCLLAAGFGGLFSNVKLNSRLLQDDTNATVRLIANIFVVMTSLTLGLMINAAHHVPDQRTQRPCAGHRAHPSRPDDAGDRPQADQARRHLIAYVRLSLEDPNIADRNPQAEVLLDAVGTSLREMRPAPTMRRPCGTTRA